MTKKEIRNTINKSVYEYAETLGYTMSDDGDGVRHGHLSTLMKVVVHASVGLLWF